MSTLPQILASTKSLTRPRGGTTLHGRWGLVGLWGDGRVLRWTLSVAGVPGPTTQRADHQRTGHHGWGRPRHGYHGQQLGRCYFGSLQVAEGAAVKNLDLVPVPVFVMDDFEPLDPPHEWDQSRFQFNLGENNGFVAENEKSHPGFGFQAMGYHVREHLPVLYGLADHFTLCQRWHASVMGPTWPNRYYMHACTSGGGKTNFPNPFLKTLWHRCDEVGITSRMYFSDVPWVTGAFPLIPTVWSKLADDFGGFNLNTLTNPNTLSRGDLPNFTIIDPGFNDDHPSHNIQLGEILIGALYKALAESPVWKKILFIITYDEHGGLSDVQFEHCSVGATLMKRFGIAPLNERMANAADVSSCIHPDYIDDPQPGPPVPLIDASISNILADVGHTTSQEELFLAAGVTLDEPFRRKVQADTLALLMRAQKLGVVRLRP